jgi:chorismate--pyruvate lyase
MRQRSLTLARWHAHVNGVNPSPSMCTWLADRRSLTLKLRAHCASFRVQCLLQRQGIILTDEATAIGLARPAHVWVRDVLLHCDGMPVVFAHTVVPLSANATDWPLFNVLGERSLGTTLFGDPQVQRGALHYARVREGHPLRQRMQAVLPAAALAPILYARRCLYRRKNGLLLVTEVFMPAIRALILPAL